MPSLFRFLTVVAVIVGIVYGVIFALANFVNPKPREMTVTDPAGQIPQEIDASGGRMGQHRDPRPPTPKLTGLFLDMLAAEQGAGDNTLDAYRRDLEDFSDISRPRRPRLCRPPTPRTCATISPISTDRGFKSTSVARRLSAMRHLFRFLSATSGMRSDDPAAILSGRSAAAACRRCCRSPMSTGC